MIIVAFFPAKVFAHNFTKSYDIMLYRIG